MHKERLTTLAKHLRTVAPENFGLEAWRCGTVACAVGHACSIPEFRTAGLRLEVYDGTALMPGYGVWSSWRAVQAFFDLSRDQADHLFYEDQYDPACATANHVADRIEEFVRGAA